MSKKAEKQEQTESVKTRKSSPKKAETAEKPVAKKSAPKKAETVEKPVAKKTAPEKTETVEKPVAKKSAPKKTETVEKPVAKKSAPKKAETAEKPVAKKSAPKKAETAEKSTVKKSTPKKARDEGESSKTPQVLKLVQDDMDMVNPVIIAGKSSIPKKLRGLEPLSRIMRREAAEMLGEEFAGKPTVTINLTDIAVKENVLAVLRRFNACDCERCVEELSRLTTEQIPAKYVKVRKSAMPNALDELSDQLEPLRKKVISSMMRRLMYTKKRCFHEE